MALDASPAAGDVADDDELMLLVAHGREDALAELYDRYGADVFRTALRVAGDAGTAEEVVQETFLALWERATRFDRERGSVGAWLARIARNRSVDRLRAAARRLQPAPFATLTAGWVDQAAGVEWLVASGDAIAAGIPDPGPETELIRAETIAELGSALAALPEDERLPIVLAYRDGLSQSEIADRLDWPLGTVKTRSRRALQRLRRVVDAAEARVASPAALGDRIEPEPCCGAA